MTEPFCDYLIIGAGLAGASAVEGIRELDANGSITLLGAEIHYPYHRPPLTKDLWSGKKKPEDIFVHEPAFYERNGVTFVPDRTVKALDADRKIAFDDRGADWHFGKLLLATGGWPVTLPIPGGNLKELHYFRTLNDYKKVRHECAPGFSAVVIGGGFIGSELAASLCANKVHVTMIYPAASLCERVFPQSLGLSLERRFKSRGIRILKAQQPAEISRAGSRFKVVTSGGVTCETDVVLAGIGIHPAVELAAGAGLETKDGIRVNAWLETSRPDIFAAGDNARFPYRARGPAIRMEHWDNALNQGRQAGRNMAGAHQAYDYMPYFFSDLFEFGYEAVGNVDPALEVVADWQVEHEKGTLYYTKDGIVEGALMCKVWDKVEDARVLIRGRLAPPIPAHQGAIA